MNIMKTIRAYNARLRTAIKNYGDDSKIVKDMITRAKFATDLTFNENGTISTGKINDLQNPEFKTIMAIGQYVGKNTTKNIISKAINSEKLKELNKEKDKKKRYASISAEYTKIEVTMELIAQIWQEMYKAGYSVEECNEVYDELKVNKEKWGPLLTKYQNGEIELAEFVNKITSDKYAGFTTVTPEELAEMEDF